MTERRVAAAASAGSIKLPSPAPAALPASVSVGVSGQRSRLSQQVALRNSPAARNNRRVTTSVGPDADEDAEGEEDVEEDAMEEGGDTEDKELYCFCQKLSYGEVRARLILHRPVVFFFAIWPSEICCRALLAPFLGALF